jgi:hypothetical protein
MPASWLYSSAARVSLAKHQSAVHTALKPAVQSNVVPAGTQPAIRPTGQLDSQTAVQPVAEPAVRHGVQPTVSSAVQLVAEPAVRPGVQTAVPSAVQSSVQDSAIDQATTSTQIKQGNFSQNIIKKQF